MRKGERLITWLSQGTVLRTPPHSFNNSVVDDESLDISDLKEVSTGGSVQDLRKSDEIDILLKGDKKEKVLFSASSKTSHVFLTLVISMLMGIIFGFSLEKGRVFEPEIIRNQMLFTNFTMLKMFLSAAATSQLVFIGLYWNDQSRYYWTLSRTSVRKSQSRSWVTGGFLGGFILGVGMTLAGACPGMVLAQVGAWVPGAIFVLIGGLVGAIIYGLTERFLRPVLSWGPEIFHFIDVSLRRSYHTCASVMFILLVAVIAALEVAFPWETELTLPNRPNCMIFACRAWPPEVAGVLVGILQLPTSVIIGKALGSSSSYVTVVSQLLFTAGLRAKFPYLDKKRTGVLNWWQVFYVCSAIVGALFAALWSGEIGEVKGVAPVYVGFIGGALMIYGSRLAGGCTSGHGLSGMAMLSGLAFVAVPAMFIGGVASAYLMQLGEALTYS